MRAPMSGIASYRAQHQRLLAMVKQLEDELERKATRGAELRKRVSTLVGKLSLHLAAEDEVLYPKLLEHSEERVRTLAQKYLDETGGLADDFRAYADRWPSPASIDANPIAFASQTRRILATLKKRISREDDRLFPLIEKLR